MNNILFFFSTTTVGGAETNIIKISRELAFRGYSIYWCFLEDNGPMLELADFEVKVLETGVFYKNYFAFRSKYLSFLRANNIDCVLNFGLRVEIISRLISKQAGVKRIISNIRSTDDWRKFYHTFLDRMTMRTVDKWVANSNAGKLTFHRREKIPLKKIEVIYNFIEIDEQSLSISHTSKPAQVVRIGILANITAEKGYLDLIPLSKLLSDKGIKHLFICGGKDMLNQRFHRELEINNLQRNFELVGYVVDKKQFFGSIDIFLLPSYLEGMPTVLLEAMSMGIPVISTEVGGIPELIDNGINGFLVKPGDIQAFHAAIESLMLPGRTEELKRNAFKSIKKFAKSNTIDQWETVIC